MPRRRSSRLTKIQEKKNKRQAAFFVLLTGFLLLAFVFLGIPSLIKMAVFLGDLRSSTLSPETENETVLQTPQLLPLPEATNSAYLDIKGWAAPGTTVKILQNDALGEKTVVDKEGKFSFSRLSLKEGENEIRVVASDPSGKAEDKKSEPFIVIFDKTPPKLTITNPKEGAEFFEKDKEIEVAGQASPDVKVTVNGFLASVDNDGNFAKKITLSDGENEIKVEAVDKAGNRTEEKVKVKYNP